MRRTFARLGVLGLVVGAPITLSALIGSPRMPEFAGADGLGGSYIPIDSVLRLIGLVAWSLWAYLIFAVVLHGAATIAAARRIGGHRALALATSILTPRPVRSLVELAIGGALVVATLSMHATSTPRALSVQPAIASDPDRSANAPLDLPRRAQSRAKAYRVHAGDSLWRISERELGSGFRWREIYRLNEGKRFPDGRSLTDPYLIYPGWVLDLPEATNVTSHEHQNGRHDGGINDESSGPDPAPPNIGARITPPSPSPAEDAIAESGVERDADEPEKIDPSESALEIPPGLLIAASFASGLLTAHLLGTVHRRRVRRLSGPSCPGASIAPELIRDLRRAGASEMAGPIDSAIDSVIESWLRSRSLWPRIEFAVESARRVVVFIRGVEGALPGPSGGTVSPRVRFVRAGSNVVAEVDGPFPVQLRKQRASLERGFLVPVGRAPDGGVVHVSPTGMGRISIDGTAAGAIARQIVLAAAAQHDPDDLHLVLLGSSGEMRSLSPLPHAAVCHTWDEAPEALRQVELEFIRRARLFLHEGVKDIDEHLAGRSDERLAALVVVCEEPPSALGGVVEALARQAPALGAAVVTVAWPLPEVELHARAEATVELETDRAVPKVLEPLVLDDSRTREAIQIIRDAHPAMAETTEPERNESEKTTSAAPGPKPADTVPSATAPRLASAPDHQLMHDGESPSPPHDVVAVRCLGPMEISRRAERITGGWRAKGRELIAYLVANPAGTPKERVIEELWPDVEPDRASLRFNKCAARVRAVARGIDDSRVYVERVGDSAYRLEEGSWWVDAWEFERLVRGAERDERATDALLLLRDAMGLYRGEFCDDAYYPWLEPVRERFRSMFTDACARFADLLSARGDHDQALSVLDRAIRVDPVCEDLVRRAMNVEAELGRRAAALARYRKLEATLDAELDVEPDPETQALVRQLLHPRERAG